MPAWIERSSKGLMRKPSGSVPLARWSDRGRRLHAVHVAAELDVHEDQVGLILEGSLDRQVAGAHGRGHVVAQPLQHRLKVFGDDSFVFHD
jgi:hypothetical protein